MKLRKGDVVLLKATIHLVEAEAIFVILGEETHWSRVDPRAVDRVLRQHLEPGDMVQGGKVLMLWPEDEQRTSSSRDATVRRFLSR